MEELTAQLTALTDRLAGDADRSETVANDQRSTLGDATYYEGRAAGLAEAASYVGELRDALRGDLVVVSGYVTPTNAPMSVLAQSDAMTRFRALSETENGRVGS